jgi:2-keto-4-pentenoate hydratase
VDSLSSNVTSPLTVGRSSSFGRRRRGRLLTVIDEVVGEAAAELLGMRTNRRVVPDLSLALRPETLSDAYAIQRRVVAALAAQADGRCIGYKVACTSAAAQSALQTDRPLFGRLMSNTTSRTGATLPADRFTRRVVEAEFAFRLGADVEPVDGGHTPATISESIDVLLPAIEIVDHRFESLAVGALRIVADNAIHGWWVSGEPVTEWQGWDLAASAVSVARNGEVVTSGSGRAVLGHPLNAMAWLADELPRFGLQLRRGDVVTTGAAAEVFEANAGDWCTADFGPLGTVIVAFD